MMFEWPCMLAAISLCSVSCSLEEFTDGFGRFLCYAGGDEDGTGGGGGGGGGTVGDGDTGDSSDNDSELFDQMLRQIHGEEIVKDPHSLKHIWKRLRGSDPSAVNLFEEFICKVGASQLGGGLFPIIPLYNFLGIVLIFRPINLLRRGRKITICVAFFPKSVECPLNSLWYV